MAESIQFLGAAETVTGSRHLIQSNGKQILVDCGLYQGNRETRALNWLDFEPAPHEIDAVVITHAHTDHIGLLPKLVREGYRGPIYSTKTTLDLARISLPDGGRLQEEEARNANKRGSRHRPALPLYTERDAFECLKQFRPVTFHQNHSLPGGMTLRFRHAGHILGSTFAEIYFESGEMILMGGDLGRYNTPIIRDPETVDHAEYLVVESTYGNRHHAEEDTKEKIAGILEEVWREGATLLIPSFAIGRTQELFYYFAELQQEGRMPRIPIFLDSPMATSVTGIYQRAKSEHDDETQIACKAGYDPIEPEGVVYVRDRTQSKELNVRRGPMIIISGSGMANGGRIVHHLKLRLGDPQTFVLFTGYQAEGTLGRKILEGEPTVTIHGEEVAVRARVDKLNSLSAHADQDEILQWLGGFKTPPKKTFIVHGEPPAQAELAKQIRERLSWEVVIPTFQSVHDLR